MVTKRKTIRKTKSKVRRCKGKWDLPLGDTSGIKYKEDREAKRQRIMAERAVKAQEKAEQRIRDQQNRIAKLKSDVVESRLRYDARKYQSQSRQLHPLRRLVVKGSRATGKVLKPKSRRSKITMF